MSKLQDQIKQCLGPNGRDFMRIDYSLSDNLLSLRQAAKMKCLDCTCGERSLAKECSVRTCALWPYRGGLSPHPKRQGSPLTPERRACLSAGRRAAGVKTGGESPDPTKDRGEH